MSDDPLPRVLDFRKAAQREVSVTGMVKPAQLPRLRALLAGDAGTVRVGADFFRDDEGRNRVALRIRAGLRLQCQRCLGDFDSELSSESELAAVADDSQARLLPASLEPVIVDGELDLWQLVEEELVLAVPPFPRHADPACLRTLTDGGMMAEAPPAEAPARDNPFEVLAQLKQGRDPQQGE